MRHIIYSYDSDKERVTIRADDKVIGILSEINIDSVVFVVQTIAMSQKIKNNKNLR